MANPDLSNLGGNVSTRQTNYGDLVRRAWGEEYYAPDHNIYKFSNGRCFDSTDKGLTGLYGVTVTPPLEFDRPDPRLTISYPDMDFSITTSDGDQEPLHIDV